MVQLGLEVCSSKLNSLWWCSTPAPIPHHNKLFSLSQSDVLYILVYSRGSKPKSIATIDKKQVSVGVSKTSLATFPHFSFSPIRWKGKQILDSTITHLLLKSILFGEESNNWTLCWWGQTDKLLSVIQRVEKNIFIIFGVISQSSRRQSTIKDIMERMAFWWIWLGWTLA